MRKDSYILRFVLFIPVVNITVCICQNIIKYGNTYIIVGIDKGNFGF